MKPRPVRLALLVAVAGFGLLVRYLAVRPDPLDAAPGPPAVAEYTRLVPIPADLECRASPMWSVTEYRGQPCVAHEYRLALTPAGELEGQSWSEAVTRDPQDRAVTVRTESRWTYQATPPYRLVRLRRSGPDEPTVELAPGKGGVWELTTSRNGFTHVRPVPDPDYALGDDLTPDLWLAKPGRAVGDRAAFRGLDDTTGEVTPTTVRVTAISPLGEGRTEFAYELRLANGRIVTVRQVGTQAWQREGSSITRPVDARPDLSAWAPVSATTLPPAPLPVRDPRDVTGMTFRLRGPSVHLLRDGPGQRVKRLGDATLVFTDRTRYPVRSTVAERAKYLEDTFHHPHAQSEVRQLARRAVPDEGSPAAEKVARLVDFIPTYIAYDEKVDPQTTPELLRERKGCCRHSADLFVTLARAVGVPARTAEGFAWSGTGYGGHRWAEVVLDDGDWHPVDPTFGCEHAAAHVRLNAGDEPAPPEVWDDLSVEVERWQTERPPELVWLAWGAVGLALLVGLRYCFEFKEPPTPVIEMPLPAGGSPDAERPALPTHVEPLVPP